MQLWAPTPKYAKLGSNMLMRSKLTGWRKSTGMDLCMLSQMSLS